MKRDKKPSRRKYLVAAVVIMMVGVIPFSGCDCIWDFGHGIKIPSVLIYAVIIVVCLWMLFGKKKEK